MPKIDPFGPCDICNEQLVDCACTSIEEESDEALGIDTWVEDADDVQDEGVCIECGTFFENCKCFADDDEEFFDEEDDFPLELEYPEENDPRQWEIDDHDQ